MNILPSAFFFVLLLSFGVVVEGFSKDSPVVQLVNHRWKCQPKKPDDNEKGSECVKIRVDFEAVSSYATYAFTEWGEQTGHFIRVTFKIQAFQPN